MRGPPTVAVLVALLVVPAVAPLAQAAEGPAGYEIHLDCPHDRTLGDRDEFYTYRGCPQRVRDEADLLGQPVFVVDPTNPDAFAFHSLHGYHDADGPTAQSRGGQTHTVFTSTDRGLHWDDNPYTPSEAGLNARDAFGQYAAATTDGEGRLHLASLWSYRPDGASSLHWTLGTWRFASIRALQEADADGGSMYGGARFFDANGTDRIGTPWLVHTDGPNGTVVMTWWEGRSDEGEIRAAAAPGGDGGLRRLNLSETAAPCADGSNAAAHDGSVFVGCRRPDGTVDVLEIDPRTGQADVAGTVRLPAGTPHLAVSSKGQTAIATARASDGGVEASLAFGWSGSRWGPVRDVSDALTNASGERVTAAGVQAMRIRPESGTLHVVYMERTAPSDDVTGTLTSRTESRYAKSLSVFHPSYGPVARIDLPIGGPLSREDTRWVWDANSDAYQDQRDTLTFSRGANGSLQEFVSYGDTGVVAFARVLEDPGELSAPAPPPAPTPPQPAVDPAGASTSTATGTTSGSKLLMGVGVAGMSLAMVARLLLARSRTPSKTPDLTGDGR